MIRIFLCLFFCIFLLSAKSQTVDFTYANSTSSTVLCSPVTINFTPVCTGNPIGFTWYLGNGLTSNSAIPSIPFTTGSYSVKLVAVFQNVALEITKTIIVNPSITAGLLANKKYICKPDSILFTSSTNAINPTYVYNFGDGNLPITNNSSTITHYFANYGIYDTKVKITSANGCSDSAMQQVEVKKFRINAEINPDKGCAPITCVFSCSAAIPTTSTVAAYAWNFGDASPIATTTNNTIPHTYLDSGSYFPTILITTQEGCTNTLEYPKITFGKSPMIQTAYPKKLSYCGNETAEFIVKSNFANEYKWEFGDGTSSIFTDTTASHKYNSLGVKTVKVTPLFNGCAGTPVSFNITIKGVIARFNYKNTCIAKKTFTFTNISLGNAFTSKWDFGDNSPNVFTSSPTHTFPPAGFFITTLFVFDNATGCGDTLQTSIFTANPTLVNPDTFLCRNASTTFTILNNYNSSPGIYWKVLGFPSTAGGEPYSIKADNFGTFDTHFAILNNGFQYCPDTLTLDKTISVRGPSVSYNTASSFCTNNNFIINNTSTPYSTNDTIKNWNWTFGIPGLVDTKYQPTPFIFSAEGTYTIRLIAKDKNGCVDSLATSILVKESPFLRIFPRSQTICEGKTITLTAYHTDNLVWTPASIFTCATCDTTIATPLLSTKIYAIASNAVGCTLKDSCIVTVYNPFTAIANTKTFSACINDTVRITGIEPTNKKIEWTPNFGLSSSTVFNPLIKMVKDTTYTALLTDSIGCYTSTIDVKAKLNPPASVNAGPDRILSYDTPFTIDAVYSTDVNNILWSPVGNLNCTNCPKPMGIANVSQTFIVKVSNSNNCTNKDTVSIFVECAYANLFMASAFSPSTTGVIKYYYPQTRGIKKINRFSIYNRFGQIVYDIKNVLPNVRNYGWDGKYQGEKLAQDGYVYVLEATCELGETLNKKGSFLLLK
jgi:gliding motility-associated-like protein